jgi:hypothetical protein
MTSETDRRQINIQWWIEDKKPIIYNGMVCYPTLSAMIKTDLWRLDLVSEGYNDNAQFQVEVDLKDIKPHFV